ncbi:hypothetical protein [Maricaulis sp.]|uniref:hypothetical protein n=1 Tax=Maricaulis sp. TaxID=1486257 RepID=UPI002612C1B6|nr:hypothetical protein [Maricaulis sp.]
MLTSIVTGLCLAAQTPDFTRLWHTGGLDNPESVISDGRGGFVVSNVSGGGTERNGQGYLARLDADGQIVVRNWVSGLNAPKGLAILDGRFFVTDIDAVVEIAFPDGSVLARHTVTGANALNDIAVHDGRLFVSDSRGSRIYVFENGSWSIWLEDDALDGVNGLLAEPERLLVTTMGAGTLLAVDWADRSLRVLADGLPDADGIARATRSGYVISQWPGQVWFWRADRGRELIFDRRDEPVMMNDIFIADGRLLIPHWEPGAVSAWRIGCPEQASAPMTPE